MSKKQKKDKAARSTRQLMGIEEIKDYCIATRMGNLVFFIIKPTNISVLPDSSISARIYALLNVVKGQAEIEMLALNSKESFERNKDFYRERLSQEELPAVRRLLEQDSIGDLIQRKNKSHFQNCSEILYNVQTIKKNIGYPKHKYNFYWIFSAYRNSLDLRWHRSKTQHPSSVGADIR